MGADLLGCLKGCNFDGNVRSFLSAMQAAPACCMQHACISELQSHAAPDPIVHCTMQFKCSCNVTAAPDVDAAVCTMQQDVTHQCVSACLQTVGITWEVDESSQLGVLPSLLIVGLLLVPLCALFSGLTLGAA